MQLSAELPVKKVEVVQITIDAARKQFKFGDIENLRNKKIRIIDAFRVTQVPVTSNGDAVVADATFNKSFLVLTVKGKEDINRVPLETFNPKDNFGRRLLLEDLVVDWPKSYIEVGTTAGLTIGEAYLLNVYYE
jgi:hypothetical protein